ncbi:hypothetical protein OUZ56_007116 [Daphnia magna]|uniref:Uncharacterized protein n=1 Tax=Daphnia magna TaxID=35525 RepID=A0ABQ9YXL9_9CRUS|nr:hypothetical protein OUZ56_007116 [Daphnia magna]
MVCKAGKQNWLHFTMKYMLEIKGEISMRTTSIMSTILVDDVMANESAVSVSTKALIISQ